MFTSLIVLNHSDGTMHVHQAGCARVELDMANTNGRFEVVVRSQTEAVREIWQDFLPEWGGELEIGWDNTRFFPCTRRLPREVGTALFVLAFTEQGLPYCAGVASEQATPSATLAAWLAGCGHELGMGYTLALTDEQGQIVHRARVDSLS